MEKGFIDNHVIIDPDIDVIDVKIDWLPMKNGIIAAKGCLHIRGIFVDMSQIDSSRLEGFKKIMDEEEDGASEEVKCLYLGSTIAPRMALGLLIEPIDGGRYRRVGRLQIKEERDSPLPEKFSYLWGQPGARRETVIVI